MRIIGLCFAVFALFTAPPAAGQPSGNEVFSDLLACDPIEDAEQRLACYDNVLQQYKLRFGVIEGEPEELQAESRGRSVDSRGRASRSSPAGSRSGAGGETRGDETAGRRAGGAGGASGRGAGRRNAAAATSPAQLDLPHETTITGFNANQQGDYRLRIAEGFVFEKAGGPEFSQDPSGKTVTLSKNFMGNWRLAVPGESQELWVSPVDTDASPASAGDREGSRGRAGGSRQDRTPGDGGAEAANAASGDESGEARGSRGSTGRVTSPEDVELPHETKVTGYNANQRGDFRLRTAEGFVFEKAGGPDLSEDPSGKTVTLKKNFMGNWRLEVPGESRQIWVTPVRGDD